MKLFYLLFALAFVTVTATGNTGWANSRVNNNRRQGNSGGSERWRELAENINHRNQRDDSDDSGMSESNRNTDSDDYEESEDHNDANDTNYRNQDEIDEPADDKESGKAPEYRNAADTQPEYDTGSRESHNKATVKVVSVPILLFILVTFPLKLFM